MLAALSLLAATLTWSPYNEALARAKAEKKLVIVYLRATSEKASAESDAALERIVANENIAVLLDSFVLARKEGRLAGISARPPALVALDPDGRGIVWQRVGNEHSIGTTLAALREHTPEILRSWEMRATVSKAAADVIFGRQLVSLGAGLRAADLLKEAAADLRREGLPDLAAYADLWVGVAQYGAGVKVGGKMTINGVLKIEGLPAPVIAEAYCILGDIAAAERKFPDARAYYRKAYDIAPPGSSVLRRARQELETYERRPLPPKGDPRVATVRLITPTRRSMVGKIEVVAEADPGVASVELFLDDAPVAKADSRPFRLAVDVGPAAVMRTLKLVAYDDSGQRIGEDVATVNDRVGAFRIAITAPSEAFVSGSAPIEADVHVPEGRKIERMELYWKDRLLTTLHKPPFRTTFQFPNDFGYIRAVGVLDDGTTVEDARLVNTEGTSASVDVRAVTLYANVTDASGKLVEGLSARDFVVLDEGKPVEVNVIRATDTPVTIGITIDSSGSMEQWMFQALELATGFVRSGGGSDDRTFVTSFDTAPRLVHEPSTDFDSLRGRILGITVGGGTSIFDGVIFALQQFQDVPGRKALLVISDGREGFSSQSAAAAVRTARAAAIPIYSISQYYAQSLSALSAETGGVTFQPRASEEQAVFARIRDDVRGQYLITFRPQAAKAGSWRKLEVRTKRPDLKVRTVSGYYAR